MDIEEFIDKLFYNQNLDQKLTIQEFQNYFVKIYSNYPSLPQLDEKSLQILYNGLKNFNNNIIDIKITYKFISEEIIPIVKENSKSQPQNPNPEQQQPQPQPQNPVHEQPPNPTKESQPQPQQQQQQQQQNQNPSKFSNRSNSVTRLTGSVLQNIIKNNDQLREYCDKKVAYYLEELQFYSKSIDIQIITEQEALQKTTLLFQAFSEEMLKISLNIVKYKEELEQRCIFLEVAQEEIQKSAQEENEEMYQNLSLQKQKSAQESSFYKQENEKLAKELEKLKERHINFSDLETELFLKNESIQKLEQQLSLQKDETKSLEQKNKLLIEQNHSDSQIQDIFFQNNDLNSQKKDLQSQNLDLTQQVKELQSQIEKLKQNEQKYQQLPQFPSVAFSDVTDSSGNNYNNNRISTRIETNQKNLLQSLINAGNEIRQSYYPQKDPFTGSNIQFYEAPKSELPITSQDEPDLNSTSESQNLQLQQKEEKISDFDMETPQPKDHPDLDFQRPTMYDHVKKSQKIKQNQVTQKDTKYFFFINPYNQNQQDNYFNNNNYQNEDSDEEQEQSNLLSENPEISSNNSSKQGKSPSQDLEKLNKDQQNKGSLENKPQRSVSDTNIQNLAQQNKPKKSERVYDLLDYTTNTSIQAKLHKLGIEYKTGELFSDKGYVYTGSQRLHVWIVINHKYIYLVNPQGYKIQIQKSLQLIKNLKIVLDSSTFTQIDFKISPKEKENQILLENFRQPLLIKFITQTFKKNYDIDLQVGFQKQFTGNHKIMHNVYIYNNLTYQGYLEHRVSTFKMVSSNEQVFGILTELGILLFDKPGGRKCSYVAVTSETKISPLALNHQSKDKKYGFEVHSEYQSLHNTFYCSSKEEEMQWIKYLSEFQKFRKHQDKEINKKNKEIYKIQQELK